ncbi:MAG: hypothetical protein HQK96_06795 [Nitrospirae bacterium]|nr:hypothetical protein [Nitrospirota bacterium]
MAKKPTTVANQPGMGAIPNAKVVTFRVWAPHAEKVYVTGTFNDWNETSTPLFSEPGGIWSTEVAGAKVGDQYRYIIHAPADWNLAPMSRIDPYARKVTNSFDRPFQSNYPDNLSLSFLRKQESSFC